VNVDAAPSPATLPTAGKAPSAPVCCADAEPASLRPEVAEARQAVRGQATRRLRELREQGRLPLGTRCTVEAWAVSGLDGIAISVRIPPIALHAEADRERARQIDETAAALAVELDDLLAAHQTTQPFRADIRIRHAARDDRRTW
jgi:hypothetical protein